MKKLALLLILSLLVFGCTQPAPAPQKPSGQQSQGNVVVDINGSNVVYGQTNTPEYLGNAPGYVPTVNASGENKQEAKKNQSEIAPDYRSMGAKFQFGQDVNQKLKIYVFDVGYGESVLVKKGDFEILFDAGREGSGVSAKLQKLGVNKIEAVVATTDDEKRRGGISQILKDFPVSEVWTSGDAISPEFKAGVLDAAAETGIPIRHPQDGDELSYDGINFSILNPPEKRLTGNPDVNSIVVKITEEDFCMLLTSNMEGGVESRLIGRGGLKCDILKIGKYGAGSATDSNLIFAVSPKDAILSVGANSEGNPNPTILERLRLKGITLYRTDALGDITIESDGTDYEIRSG